MSDATLKWPIWKARWKGVAPSSEANLRAVKM